MNFIYIQIHKILKSNISKLNLVVSKITYYNQAVLLEKCKLNNKKPFNVICYTR